MTSHIIHGLIIGAISGLVSQSPGVGLAMGGASYAFMIKRENNKKDPPVEKQTDKDLTVEEMYKQNITQDYKY